MYCYKCGKELPPGSAFCAFCGTQQSLTQQNIAAPAGGRAAAVSSGFRDNRAKKKGIVAAASAVIIVIIALIICWVSGLFLPVLELTVGDEYVFGDYEWVVLDVQGDKALLLTKDIVGLSAFHESGGLFGSWEGSTMCEWLNDNIYNSFSEIEQRIIVLSFRMALNPGTIRLDKDGLPVPEFSAGNATVGDKVFLLSLYECGYYLGGDGYRLSGDEEIDDEFNNGRIAKLSTSEPTIREVLAVEHGAKFAEATLTNEYWMWALCDAAYDGYTHVRCVRDDGRIDLIDSDYSCIGVRPAIWINLRGASSAGVRYSANSDNSSERQPVSSTNPSASMSASTPLVSSSQSVSISNAPSSTPQRLSDDEITILVKTFYRSYLQCINDQSMSATLLSTESHNITLAERIQRDGNKAFFSNLSAQ